MISFLSYLAAAWILFSYFYLLRHPGKVFWLNLSNAIGFIPLALVEWQAKTYGPLIISFAFGIMGIFGILTGRKHNRS